MPREQKWKGSTEVQELPDSPEIEVTATSIRITRRFEGPYQAVSAQRPAIFSEMAGFPGIAIESSRLQRAPGKRGRLTLIATLNREDSTGSKAPIADPIPEIDWVRISKPIESHPRFKDISPADLRKIKNAVQNPSETSSPYFADPEAQKLYIRLLRGQESYDVWAPLIRTTTEHLGKPDTGDCGQIVSPPISVDGDWIFMKTADSARMENRRWKRTQEYTGADEIDEEIYG